MILVTGGCGFIASNYIETIIDHNDVINLDCLSYAGNPQNTAKFKDHPNYQFVQGDIGNKDLVSYLFETNYIDLVVNFAAETHVDNSINSSEPFFKTNVLGTLNLIDCANKNWVKRNYDECLFVQISTDEVNGSLGLDDNYEWTEDEVLKPSSPYSASKAAAEHVVMSYYKTYGTPVMITRSSNNYGPNQHCEKFIPTIISSLMNVRKIPIYGDGKNVRDWIYVKDNCDAINYVIQKGKVGEIYNIGAGNLVSNIDLVHTVLKADKELYGVDCFDQISFVKDRKGHDQKYNISTNKLEALGWKKPNNEYFYKNILTTVASIMERS